MSDIKPINNNLDEQNSVELFVTRMFDNFTEAQLQLFMQLFNKEVQTRFQQKGEDA